MPFNMSLVNKKLPQSLKRTAFACAGAIVLVGFAACASTSGVNSFDKAEVSSTSLASYSSVYIADVQVSDALQARTKIKHQSRYTGNDERPVSQRDLNKKATLLKKKLKYEIGKSRNVVSSPGANVLTVEATLTDLRSNRPTQADLSANTSLSFQSVYAGKASAVFVLSNQDQELARLQDSYQGDLNDPIPAGIWSDVDRSFGRWARNLAAAINNG